jgi:predicted nucleic acid-binding protein
MQFHWLDVEGSSISRDSFFKTLPQASVLAVSVKQNATSTSCVEQLSDGTQVPVCAWNSSEEYATIRDGLVKDSTVINEVAQQTGVSARLIAATVVPEQLRWFTDDRETFKQLFEPLKILGVAANMTYGIGGIYPDTGNRIEQYAQDTDSPFYAGPGMSALISYPSVENPKDNTMLARLSDSKDHYYSYLYVALFDKEITNQWARAGYDISNRPDVIVTLYNIGFDKSIPKTNPQIGGATITVNGTKYSYGELGVDFYYSDELTKVFPIQY